LNLINNDFIRLDIGPYQAANFFQQEEEMAKKFGLFHHRSWPKKTDCQSSVIITNTHTDFTLLMKRIDSIKLLIHPNSGYDNIPIEFVQRADFPIVLGNPIRANAVAEYVLAQVLERFTSIGHQESWQAGREWPRKLLKEQNILIMGHGHIAKILTPALRPLVKDIESYDPFALKNNGKIESLIPNANIIIPLMSLNKTSRHFLNEDFFKLVKEDILLVNGARGKLIDQKALLSFLNKNPKAYAALDVFENEPYHREEFKGIINLKRTCHIAGVYKALDREILRHEEKVLQDFISMSKQEFSQQYYHLLLKNRIHGEYLI
jgi:D-3-phosphoglycerate dehydrogenase / 2-oxoglutarate reductase